MSFLIWNDEFSVNIDEIDEQHKKLFDILSKVFVAMTTDENSEFIREAFSELSDYIQYHFHTEESYLEKNNYPELEAHKKEHRALSEKLISLKNAHQQGENNIPVSLAVFLKEWLQNHLKEEDQKYASYLSTQNEG